MVSVAVPVRVTVPPSPTVWSGPASIDGGLLAVGTSVTVTTSESVAVAVPSSAVSVNVISVSASTAGTANVVDGEASLAKTIGRVESCDHR